MCEDVTWVMAPEAFNMGSFGSLEREDGLSSRCQIDINLLIESYRLDLHDLQKLFSDGRWCFESVLSSFGSATSIAPLHRATLFRGSPDGLSKRLPPFPPSLPSFFTCKQNCFLIFLFMIVTPYILVALSIYSLQ